jgi:outer membrane lipoprotein SlyB
MTSMMFRNRPHALVVGAVVVALLSLAAVVTLRSTGSASNDGEPAAKSAVEARPAATSDARPERGATREVAPVASSSCATCGTVEAIRTVELRGDAAGAQELDQHLSRRVVYRVTVRLDDGSYRTLSQATPPSIVVGGKVRIVSGVVVAHP